MFKMLSVNLIDYRKYVRIYRKQKIFNFPAVESFFFHAMETQSMKINEFKLTEFPITSCKWFCRHFRAILHLDKREVR